MKSWKNFKSLVHWRHFRKTFSKFLPSLACSLTRLLHLQAPFLQAHPPSSQKSLCFRNFPHVCRHCRVNCSSIYLNLEADEYRKQARQEEELRDLLYTLRKAAEAQGRMAEALMLKIHLRELDKRVYRLHEKAARRYYAGFLLFCFFMSC
jgi:hypothetical protein